MADVREDARSQGVAGDQGVFNLTLSRRDFLERTVAVGGGTVGAKILLAQEAVMAQSEAVHLEAFRIGSPEEAALRFGADEYTTDPSNWDINEWGGAHLKETGRAVKANTARATVEGWIKSDMVAPTRDAVTIVAHSNVPVVELNGGTFWDYGPGNETAGFAQLWGQVLEKEAIEQPDVTVIPLCADLEPVITDVPVNAVSTPEEAAGRFGADRYSENPNNWEIIDFGGAHLIDHPEGRASLIKLDGASMEGWIKAKRINGRPAITFVAHPNVGEARAVGATLWDFIDPIVFQFRRNSKN